MIGWPARKGNLLAGQIVTCRLGDPGRLFMWTLVHASAARSDALHPWEQSAHNAHIKSLRASD